MLGRRWVVIWLGALEKTITSSFLTQETHFREEENKEMTNAKNNDLALRLNKWGESRAHN